jgi:ABC-type Zn uptake system ZnuABC Zn-binding protein ZnuA
VPAAIVLAALAGCGAAASQPARQGAGQVSAPAGGRLAVVATTSILGDMARNVGGDLVEIRTLVGPGGDAHTFEPTPADSGALAGAAALVEHGLAFEPWLDDLYSASGASALRIITSRGVKPIAPLEGEQGTGEADPHIWHDVQHAITMVGNIRDGLAQADPAHAGAYRANAEAYAAELRELDAFVRQQVDQIPPERRVLVTAHDTFGYFAQRYGFVVVGTALGAATTEVTDPSPRQIAALAQEIRAAGAPAIFAENVGNPGLLATLAAEAGVRLAPPLYTDALGEPGSAGATYIDMMRANVMTLVEALKG